MVGYNANPKECLDIVRGMGMPCVKGNHDEYCSTDETLEQFNPHAADAVNWTRKQLPEEDKKWLREFKYVRLVASFTPGHLTAITRVEVEVGFGPVRFDFATFRYVGCEKYRHNDN